MVTNKSTVRGFSRISGGSLPKHRARYSAVSRLRFDFYQLEWTEGYKNTPKEFEYNEKKGKVAREAFLAIRSRTESDFIDYFASTLCAFPQFLNEQGYATLAKALHTETEKVRTLTMLALSARG